MHPCGALGPRTKDPQCLSLFVAASSRLHVPNARVYGIEASVAKDWTGRCLVGVIRTRSSPTDVSVCCTRRT